MAKETKKTIQPSAPAKNLSSPSVREEIRRLAEEIYKKRADRPGDQLADWLEAEKQIKKKYGI